MNSSETITKVASALAKAQGQFEAAVKSGKNPHLRNTYATLDDIIAAVRGPLAANGLSFIQPLSAAKDDDSYALETTILHESGEWISTWAVVPTLSSNRGVNELQAFGSALTYMRRYMLSAMLGINTEEDDDGNGRRKQRESKAKPNAGPIDPAMPAPPPAKDNGDGGKVTNRPYAPDAIKAKMTAIIGNDWGTSASQAQVQLIASKLNECFAGDRDADQKRHSVTNYLFSIESTKDLHTAHVDALLKWLLLDGEKDSTGDYPLHPKAPAEAAAIVKAALMDAGQAELELFDEETA